MSSNHASNWSFSLGRWLGVELRVHIHLPLAILTGFLLAEFLPSVTVREVAFASVALVLSVCLHELFRFAVAERVGGHTHLIVFGLTGGWARPHLPADPPAHLVTALAGPVAYLSIAVVAAVGLVLYGQTNVLLLAAPFAPQFTPSASALHYGAQVLVWVNCCLLLANLLPVYPCDGADLLHGLLWPLTGRSSANSAMAHIAYGAALAALVLAVVLHQRWVGDLLPAWFPLALIAVVLLYGGNRAAQQSRYDRGLSIDELDSDDEQWLNADWLEDDRAVVLVKHLQEKQQETLDRKRRERESHEDQRVDDILLRLNDVGFERLSDEEQAVLKRASRRYRERRDLTRGE